MVTIATNQPVVTLINVHHCKPENQQALADLLAHSANTVFRHVPGFVSASIHKSTDGLRVTNYAQYRTRADFEALKDIPAIKPFAQQVSALIESFDAHTYDVVCTVVAG
jgi:quinol monooxygenase YgiN